jgi:hypothetical protein
MGYFNIAIWLLVLFDESLVREIKCMYSSLENSYTFSEMSYIYPMFPGAQNDRSVVGKYGGILILWIEIM